MNIQWPLQPQRICPLLFQPSLALLGESQVKVVNHVGKDESHLSVRQAIILRPLSVDLPRFKESRTHSLFSDTVSWTNAEWLQSFKRVLLA